MKSAQTFAHVEAAPPGEEGRPDDPAADRFLRQNQRPTKSLQCNELQGGRRPLPPFAAENRFVLNRGQFRRRRSDFGVEDRSALSRTFARQPVPPRRRKSFDCVQHPKLAFALKSEDAKAYVRKSLLYSQYGEGKFRAHLAELFPLLLTANYRVKEAEWPLPADPFALRSGLQQILRQEFVAFNVREVGGPRQLASQRLSRAQLAELDARIERGSLFGSAALLPHALLSLYDNALAACAGRAAGAQTEEALARLRRVMERPDVKFTHTWTLGHKRHASLAVEGHARFNRANKAYKLLAKAAGGAGRPLEAGKPSNAARPQPVFLVEAQRKSGHPRKNARQRLLVSPHAMARSFQRELASFSSAADSSAITALRKGRVPSKPGLLSFSFSFAGA